MGDHSSETLQLQNRRDDEECARVLGESNLMMIECTIPWILNRIDCFVRQSQGNKSVVNVGLYPLSVDGHDDGVWDKVGQAIGNLQALEMLTIATYDHGEDDEDLPVVNWGIVARILRHVRQRITIDITGVLPWAPAEESRLFARAIHGHPTITSLEVGRYFPCGSFDALYSVLATLPALESIKISVDPEDENTLTTAESLTELLRLPSLRSVDFSEFYFTPALCQATANALMEGTAITNLVFTKCSFSTEGSAAILANALTRNTSVSYIKVQSSFDGTLNGALAAALPSNSTWRDLVFKLDRRIDDDPDYSPVVLALGKNTALKTLTLDAFRSINESLYTAMQDGLGMNETLESLELNIRLNDDTAALWCRAFSFLRTNKALKSLKVDLDNDVTNSCVTALCRHIAVMLQENASLESLSIRRSGNIIRMKAEAYSFLITALQHNTTLKSLDLGKSRILNMTSALTDNEDVQIAALLKKNYVLERLPGITLRNWVSDMGAILRLNGAGRRYLVQDGSSVTKGVEVLSRVNNDINCVFLHLLENPRLCDRSAVEKVSADEIADSGGGEKREQAGAHKGRESRRRLE
jgi:hypothetical protein